MKKSRIKSGFTLIELIVTIAILAILLLLIVPSVSGYVQQARTVACSSNRKTLYGMMESEHAMGRVSELSQTSLEQIEASYQGQLCPDGGTYTWVSAGEDSGTIICSKHPDAGSSGGTQAAGTVQVSDSDGRSYTVSATREWSDIAAAAANGQVTIAPGTVIRDASGIYVFNSWNNVLSLEPLTFAAFQKQYGSQLVQVTAETVILTASDTVNGSHWKSAPAQGTIVCIDGKYYIAPTAESAWTMPPSGWITIDSSAVRLNS